MIRFAKGEKVLILDRHDEEMQGRINLVIKRVNPRTLPALLYHIIVNQYLSVYAIDNKDRPCRYNTNFPSYRVYKFEEVEDD